MPVSMQQICGSNFSYQHMPLTRCFEDMAALGRAEVELWGVVPQLHAPWMSDAQAGVVRRLAEGHGLRIICFTPEQVRYPMNIASPDSRLRSHSISVLKRSAELAVELGGARLFLTPGRGLESEPMQAGWDRAVDSLGEIVGYANDLGIETLLEPLRRLETNLVTTAADAHRMIREIGFGSLGVALDTVTMAYAEETVDDYFDALGDRVRHVHLIDGTPSGHLAWGDGDLALEEMLEAFGRRGYTGAMNVELFGDGSYAFDPRTPLQRSYRRIAQAIASVEEQGRHARFRIRSTGGGSDVG